MSKTYPECPLYNHLNCKNIDNSKVCAIVREDKVCVKKRTERESKKLFAMDFSMPVSLVSKIPILCEIYSTFQS